MVAGNYSQSPDQHVSNGDVSRPRSMTRELSHPGALLGQVTGHVKDGQVYYYIIIIIIHYNNLLSKTVFLIFHQ